MEEVTGSAEPEDAQKWISSAEAAEMLRLSRHYFMQTAKKRGYTRRQANRNTHAPFFLRKEIESWADFRNLRRQWLAKYPGRGRTRNATRKRSISKRRERLFIHLGGSGGAARSGARHDTAHGAYRAACLLIKRRRDTIGSRKILVFTPGRDAISRKTRNA